MGSDGTGMSLQESYTGILYAHTNIHIAVNEYGYRFMGLFQIHHYLVGTMLSTKSILTM